MNYTTKYASQIAERFHTGSITDAAAGHDYDFTGARSVRVYSVNTVEETDYARSGENRFGAVHDLDTTLQEMMCTRAPAFSFTIDALDNSDVSIDNAAGKALRRQLDEVTIPNMDRYRLKKWCMEAGTPVLMDKVPTVETIAMDIMDLSAAMTERGVPTEGRTLFIATPYYKLLKLCDAVDSVKSLGKEAVEKGVVGAFDGMKVVSVVTGYLPQGVYFMIKHKSASVDPVKLAQYDVLPKVQGYSGPVAQGVTYYDAFVLGARNAGIGVAGSAECILAAPTVTVSGGKAAIAAVDGAEAIRYTTDGSDPRCSASAEVYSAAVAVSAGQTIRAVAVADGKCGAEGTAKA